MQYNVEVPGHPEKNRTGQESWGGIPLVWATDLFLGKVPCPSPEDRSKIKIGQTTTGDLMVADADEVFVYHFNPGSTWPETVHWKKGVVTVDFRFDEIDPKTNSPMKWEAVSADGEVKTRWRDRELH